MHCNSLFDITEKYIIIVTILIYLHHMSGDYTKNTYGVRSHAATKRKS